MARIEAEERGRAVAALARHFIEVWGAPSEEAAEAAAQEEIGFMVELCADHPPNTILTVSRSLTEAGVRERFRAIAPSEAELDLVAVHATPD